MQYDCVLETTPHFEINSCLLGKTCFFNNFQLFILLGWLCYPKQTSTVESDRDTHFWSWCSAKVEKALPLPAQTNQTAGVNTPEFEQTAWHKLVNQTWVAHSSFSSSDKRVFNHLTLYISVLSVLISTWKCRPPQLMRCNSSHEP